MRTPTLRSAVPQSKSFAIPSIRRRRPAADRPPASLERSLGGLTRVASRQHAVRSQFQSAIEKRAHHGKACFAHRDSLVLVRVIGIANVEQLVAHILVLAAHMQAHGQPVQRCKGVEDGTRRLRWEDRYRRRAHRPWKHGLQGSKAELAAHARSQKLKRSRSFVFARPLSGSILASVAVVVVRPSVTRTSLR